MTGSGYPNHCADGDAAAPLVLHVRVVAGSGGGPDKTVLRSARYAASAGLNMGAAYIHPRRAAGIAAVREQAAAHDCPLWTIPERGPLDPRTVGRLLRLCRQQRVRIWHGHDYKSNALGLLLRRFHPMKLVTTVHGWTDETIRTRLYARIDRWCLPRYDQVIAVSRRLHADCLAAGVSPERLSYLPNGIDPSEYQRRHSRNRVRRRLDLDPDQFALGVVGRLSLEKGVDRAVRLLPRLQPSCPNVQLHLIGDGPERSALRALATQLNVRDRVTFWGWQRQMAPFYEMLDLLVLPSHTEGLPNAVLEALAMHTPVAATDVGDVRHLLDDGRCGILLADDDTAWPRQLAPLITSSAQRAQLTERGRQRIEQHFSFAQRMDTVMQVYRRVLPEIAHPAPLRRAA